jgi:hypothetical protein
VSDPSLAIGESIRVRRGVCQRLDPLGRSGLKERRRIWSSPVRPQAGDVLQR